MSKRTNIICIVGLPGSGKTFLAQQKCLETGGIVLDDITSFKDVASAIRDYDFIYITDPHFCIPEIKNSAERKLSSLADNINLEWIYFENDVEKCLSNIKFRNDKRNVRPTIDIYSKIYVPPEEALSIWQSNSKEK